MLERKRGRPRKNVEAPIKNRIDNPEVPRKRGRPKKIENLSTDIKEKKPVGRPRKNPLPTNLEVKKPRGRPRKNPLETLPSVLPQGENKEKAKFFQTPQAVFAKHDQTLNTPSINFKTTRLLGYCPKCNLIIGESEMSKDRFTCPKCEVEDNISALNKESTIKDSRPVSKKEYLEDRFLNDDHTENYSQDINIDDIISSKTNREDNWDDN
jgi:DNA-directed RNA polymerase subunit M/transcription elongation factor TFIIS